MTYSTGGLIQATDYNGFVNTTANANLNAVWNTAYGQSALATVSPSAIITATQWATLNNTLAAAAAHQGTSITARTSPTAGSIISVLSAMNTDLTNLNTNKYNAASLGGQVAGNGSGLTAGYGSGSSAWTATFTSNITFASAAAAQYFFNAGGLVKIQFGKSSTGTVADTEWNAFANSLGTLYFTSTGAAKTINGTSYTGTTLFGGAGSPTVATGIGYYQLTGAGQQIFLEYDYAGGTYVGNYIQVLASFSGSTLTFTTYWHSDGGATAGSTDQISGGSPTSGASFGTAAATLVTYYSPETTYLANSWGSPSISNSAG